jgi:transposase
MEVLKMQRGIYISKEQIAELEEARKQNKNIKADRRIRAVLLHAQGVNHKTIAEYTEFAVTYIGELVAKYVDHGIEAIAGNNYHGNRRNMSFEEEEALLSEFREKAQNGQIVEISEIKEAYEKASGRSMEKSRGQIYRVLKRHGWRKVMPRSKHPEKADDEAIEASKKLTKQSEMRWKILKQQEM